MQHHNQLNFFDMGEIEIVSGTSSHSFPLHIHQCICIGMIIKGKAEFIYQDSHSILDKGSIYLIKPYTLHSISSINNVEYSYITFCLRKSFVEKYSHFIFPHTIIDNTIYQQLFSAYNIFIQNNQVDFIYQCLDKLLCNLTLNSNSKSELGKEEYILSAIAYIENHLDLPFNLQKLSNAVNVTKYHLIRQFKAEMGITPYQFYIYKKIILIKQCLLKQQVLSDIAAEFEFTDQSHFNHTFKKHMSITPLQFYNAYKKYCTYNKAGENLAKI